MALHKPYVVPVFLNDEADKQLRVYGSNQDSLLLVGDSNTCPIEAKGF